MICFPSNAALKILFSSLTFFPFMLILEIADSLDKGDLCLFSGDVSSADRLRRPDAVRRKKGKCGDIATNNIIKESNP